MVWRRSRAIFLLLLMTARTEKGLTLHRCEFKLIGCPTGCGWHKQKHLDTETAVPELLLQVVNTSNPLLVLVVIVY